MSQVNYPESLRGIRKSIEQAAKANRHAVETLAYVQNRLHDFEGLPESLKPQLITKHDIEQVSEPLLISDRQLFDYLAGKYKVTAVLKASGHGTAREERYGEVHPEDFNFGSAVITAKGIVAA